ncbi:MAG: MlaD family protein [Rhizobiaceae bacterium]
METRANYIAVGFFTLAAIVTVFAVIFWFNRFGEDDNLVPVDIRIQGSVSGLGPASLVQFNGIDVGRVKALSLDSADPRFVIIHALVNSATPIRADTVATIGIRGLSGGAFIQLEGGSPTAATLLDPAVPTEQVPIIQGDPAAMADLLNRVNRIAGQTERVMSSLEGFVQANSETLTRTIDNAETFSNALAQNSDGVARFMDSAGDVAKSLQDMSQKLDGSLKRVEEILVAIDPAAVKKTVENVETFTTALAEQRGEIDAVVATVKTTADQLNTFTDNLNTTLAKVDGVVDAVDKQAVATLIADASKTATRMEQLLTAFEGESLNKTINEAQAATSQARKILENVDAEQVRTLVADLSKASNDASQLMAALDATKINKTVDDLSAAAAGAQTIVDDVAKVTGPLSQRSAEVDQMVVDASKVAGQARKILESIDETQVRSLMTDLSKATGDVSKLVEAIDAAKINSAVDNFSTAAEGAQTIVSDIAKVTTPFGERSAEIDKIITDASELAARLNESSKKVDGILNQASALVGSDASEGLIADARSTLLIFQETARSFDRRVGSIASDVSAFTKRGLGDTQGLIRDARRSLNQFERVMRNLQNNPGSLLSGAGGSRVRESSGSRVRR